MIPNQTAASVNAVAPLAVTLPVVRTLRAAIRAGHVDTGADDPTGHDGVRRVLQGLTRQAAGRGRGQADPLTADDVAAILATASLPRRTGRGMESEAAAADRGAIDKAIAGLLFQGGLRRSEAAALRWADVQDAADGRGIVVYVRRSKTDQDGTAADVRYLKNGCAAALRQLRDRLTVQRSGLRPDGTAQVPIPDSVGFQGFSRARCEDVRRALAECCASAYGVASCIGSAVIPAIRVGPH